MKNCGIEMGGTGSESCVHAMFHPTGPLTSLVSMKLAFDGLNDGHSALHSNTLFIASFSGACPFSWVVVSTVVFWGSLCANENKNNAPQLR